MGERLKVGQQVRVVGDHCEYKGETGTITEDDGAEMYPWRVEFAEPISDETWYDYGELEAVEADDEDEDADAAPESTSPVTVFAVGRDGPPLAIFADLREAIEFARRDSESEFEPVSVYEYAIGHARDEDDSDLIAINVSAAE